LYIAEMVTLVVVVTGVVFIAKVALLDPAATTTLAGIVTAALFLFNVTVVSAAATPVRVTVPVDGSPPTRLFGFSVSVLNAGGLTVRDAVLVTLRYVADTVPVVTAETGTVVITNVAVRAPAGTVTLTGTVAALFVVPSATVSAAAVAPVRVTVPVDCAPPSKVLGLSEMELMVGGFTVNVPEFLTTPL
jgi:hypothetical protein